jgi:hypothetical protein
MDIEDLEPGAKAPEDSDRIALTLLPSGKFEFSGVVLTGSVEAHFADHRTFDTLDEARNAGITWAKEKGAATLLIELPAST